MVDSGEVMRSVTSASRPLQNRTHDTWFCRQSTGSCGRNIGSKLEVVRTHVHRQTQIVMATLSSFWILLVKVLLFLELSTWYLIPTLAGGPDQTAESKCEEKQELKWVKMPGEIIEDMDMKSYYNKDLTWCKNACLLDEEFPCRTVEFNDNKKECRLSDKRRADDGINLIKDMEFSLYEWECRQITTTTKVTPRIGENMITPTPYDPWDWAPEYWVLLGGGVVIIALFITAICSICVLTMKPKKNKKFLLEDTRA